MVSVIQRQNEWNSLLKTSKVLNSPDEYDFNSKNSKNAITKKSTSFGKPKEITKNSKDTSFRKKIRSLTSRFVLRRKSNDLRDTNVKRCHSWPSYENNSRTSVANHLSSLASSNRNSPCLEKILRDKIAFDFYYEFLKKEYAEENILFLSEVEKYKEIKSENVRRAKADEIYRNYIVEDSPREINIFHKTRLEVSEKIVDLETTLFDKAQKHILFLLEKDSFKRFLSVSMNF